jgi:hypothetical protein
MRSNHARLAQLVEARRSDPCRWRFDSSRGRVPTPSLIDSVLSAREGTPTAHGDGIQSQDGNNVVIRHNTLLETNPVTSAIITNPALDNGWVMEDNFMGGGAYTLYCPEQDTNFVVRDMFVPAKLGSLHSAASVSPTRATTRASRGLPTIGTPTAAPSRRSAVSRGPALHREPGRACRSVV